MTAPLIHSADYDYLPIEGADLVLGDQVLWAAGVQIVVDEITLTPVDGGMKYTFSNADDSVQPYAYDPAESGPYAYETSIYRVTAHPAVGATFTHTDGSRWVFTASKYYRCFVASAAFPLGTVMPRSSIAGQLVVDP